MTGRAPFDETPRAEPALLGKLFLLMKHGGMFGRDHPTAHKTAEAVQKAIEAVGPPFTLEFIGQATFKDRMSIPVEIELFDQTVELGKALANLAVQEISFDEVPELDALLALSRALANGAQGRSSELHGQRLRGIRFRDLPLAKYGEEAEQVESQVFTAAQIALAIRDAEDVRRALADGAWPWLLGVSVVRRLELALEADTQAAERAVELGEGAWTPPRRAVAAAFLVAQLLLRLEATRLTRRAVAHAAFALATFGYQEREGDDVAQAAGKAVQAMVEAPVTAESGVDPHRLRTCTLVHRVAEGARQSSENRLVALLELAYRLERRRCPAGVTFELTRVDLLAELVHDMGAVRDATWVRAIVGQSGAVPLGAYVMADGKLGVVMEAGSPDDPLRPKVLVGGQLITPERPVLLHSPIGMTPWVPR